MAFDFPVNPVAGLVYTDATTGLSYTFDGVVWVQGAGGATTSPYVLKAGDVMLGTLSLVPGSPTAPVHATHKKYVDDLVAAESLFQGVWQVAANTPDLDPAVALPLHSYSWVAQTVDPAVPELAPAGLPGIGGRSIAATDTIIWNANTSIYEQVRGAVSVAQMLIADAPPATAFHGQNWWDSNSGKMYVFYDDGNSTAWVQTSGGGGTSRYVVPAGDVMPTATELGELFWNTADASLYIWHDDGTSTQWVDVSA